MKQFLGMLLGGIAGAAVGYALYRFVGCRTGACPLTGNPLTAILIPAVAGILTGAGVGTGKASPRRKVSSNQNNNER